MGGYTCDGRWSSHIDCGRRPRERERTSAASERANSGDFIMTSLLPLFRGRANERGEWASWRSDNEKGERGEPHTSARASELDCNGCCPDCGCGWRTMSWFRLWPKAAQIAVVINEIFWRPFFFSAEKGERGWVRGSRGDFIPGLKWIFYKSSLIVGFYCGVLLWGFIVGFYCGVLLWGFIVGFYCEILLWDFIVGSIRRILLWDLIIVGFYCGI
jgi:hypothetical protein